MPQCDSRWAPHSGREGYNSPHLENGALQQRGPGGAPTYRRAAGRSLTVRVSGRPTPCLTRLTLAEARRRPAWGFHAQLLRRGSVSFPGAARGTTHTALRPVLAFAGYSSSLQVFSYKGYK